MKVPRLRIELLGFWILLLGLLAGLACARTTSPTPATPQPSAAPTPSTPTTPASTPTTALTPSAKPTPTAPVTTGRQPLVPGGPPFYRDEYAKTMFGKLLIDYHHTKLPLWTKASYGGELRGAGTGSIATATIFNYLSILNLGRPTTGGMLFLMDTGLCSMVGREGKFDTCGGKYGNADDVVIIPGIVQTWKQDDFVNYTFTLRKDVMWPAVPPMVRADREVTAADIVWFLDITKKEGTLKDGFALVDTFTTVDRYTFKVKLTTPHAEFFRNMAHNSMAIFPKECYDEKGCLGTKQISPAPFLIKENVLNQRSVSEKNPEFWLKGLPYVDRMVQISMTDANVQKAAFRTGQIDNFGTFAVSEALDINKGVPGSKLQADATLTGTMFILPQLKGPYADVRVRRAMAMTMDLESAWAANDGFNTFPPIVSPDYFGAGWRMVLQQAGENYQLNPAKARQLMADAGYSNGFKTTLLSGKGCSGGFHDQIIAIQAAWKTHLNLDVAIKCVDTQQGQTAQYGSAWEDLIFIYPFNLSYWVSTDLGMLGLVTGSRTNFQKVTDAKIDDLFNRQRGELDPVKRVAIMWEFEQYELSQVYVLRVGHSPGLQVYQPWEMNGISNVVAYCCGTTNGPSWMSMMDTTKQPKR
ncbi:MAG: ABC transporter substrate-binding protein [Dehalococcoidia bacterium]|nr:ABC transporter substrate-binding protein [Dehalococcoidia bacterium]